MKAGNLLIRWSYGDEITTVPATDPFKRKIVRQHNRTFCELLDATTGNQLVMAYSLCAPGDTFCKDTGRKLSLARAMKNANLAKEERTVIWELYRKMSPKNRW